MKNKSKFSIVKILLVLTIAFLGVFFTIRETQKINIKTKDTTTDNQIELLNNQVDSLNAVISLKNSTIEEQSATISSQASAIETKDATIASQASAIETKDATIASQADTIAEKDATISSQSSTISTQSTRINTLESELSSEYNYQFSIDVDFYVDNDLYMSGKARSGGTILIEPTAPTKSGYTFTGWSLTANGTVVNLANTTISQATSFYAIFEVEQPQSPTWDGTDLTGTTWEFNEFININTSYEFFINCHIYSAYHDYNCSSIKLTPLIPQDHPAIFSVYDTSVNYYIDIYQSSWDGPSPYYINISSGTDATSSNLITWLQANATLVSYNPNI